MLWAQHNENAEYLLGQTLPTNAVSERDIVISTGGRVTIVIRICSVPENTGTSSVDCVYQCFAIPLSISDSETSSFIVTIVTMINNEISTLACSFFQIAVPDVKVAVEGTTILVFVVPHQFVAGLCNQLKGVVKPNAIAVLLIKVCTAAF